MFLVFVKSAFLSMSFKRKLQKNDSWNTSSMPILFILHLPNIHLLVTWWNKMFKVKCPVKSWINSFEQLLSLWKIILSIYSPINEGWFLEDEKVILMNDSVFHSSLGVN